MKIGKKTGRIMGRIAVLIFTLLVAFIVMYSGFINKKAGMIELENEHDNTYKVLTAFHYMEDLVDCITISEEMNDEISQ